MMNKDQTFTFTINGYQLILLRSLIEKELHELEDEKIWDKNALKFHKSELRKLLKIIKI